MATVINSSGVEPSSKGFHTYYIKIEKDGATYYKFGSATGTINRRYAKEPPEVKITIRKLWVHTTENKMWAHEAKLFKQYKGDRPFIGRCSPLLYARGSTEVYSHDVMGGEPRPLTYDVRLFDDEGELCFNHDSWTSVWASIFGVYQAYNPLRKFEHLVGEIPYMDNAIYPICEHEFPLIQVPLKSTPERVVIASKLFIAKIIMKETQNTNQRLIGMKAAEDALKRDIVVTDYSDYHKFEFME